ncbi:hypothetical protein SOVF_154850 [Spinacia oleracea]|nr:hypothetical protein SOVF_154850 [Spinacia oleracea]
MAEVSDEFGEYFVADSDYEFQVRSIPLKRGRDIPISSVRRLCFPQLPPLLLLLQ